MSSWNFALSAALAALLACLALSGCPKKEDTGVTDTPVGGETNSNPSGGDTTGSDATSQTPPAGDTQTAGSDSGASAGDAAGGAPAKAELTVGTPAPDFNYTTLDGKSGSLSALKGKPVVVNFWATWCVPCKAEFPDFQKAYTAHPGQFELISLALSSSDDPASYVAEQKFSWTFAWDKDDNASNAYNAMVVPLTVFVDKNGNVAASSRGKMSPEQFDADLALILQ